MDSLNQFRMFQSVLHDNGINILPTLAMSSLFPIFFQKKLFSRFRCLHFPRPGSILKMPYGNQKKLNKTNEDMQMKKLLYAALSVSAALMLGACAMFASCPEGNAESFAVNNVYGSHMVLQREKPIRIVGTAPAGKSVKVTLAGKSVNAVANDQGVWEAILPSMQAGGPYTVVVTGAPGTTPISFDDVLIGEVWVCSGQSNMEMPVWGNSKFFRSKNGLEEAKNANFPNIRLFKVDRTVSPGVECSAIKGTGWQLCAPETVQPFSALGFYFGRELNHDLNVPVGLIGTNWGGTRVEPWISKAGYNSAERGRELSQIAGVEDPKFIRNEKARLKELRAKANATFNAWYKNFFGQYDAQVKAAADWKKPDFDVSAWTDAKVPGLIDSKIDGAVWFRRDVEIPEDWAGKDLILSLGIVDDCDETFFNGEKIGATGPDTPNYWSFKRRYKVPGKLVKAGKNTLAVRVIDLFADGGFTSPAKEIFLQNGNKVNTRIALAGVWKSKVEFAADVKKVGPRPSVEIAVSSSSPQFPATLYNAMIAPWIVYPVRGAIWYQGESNAGQWEDYMKLFPLLIKDWRAKWNDPAMPFVFVQLAAFERHTPAKPLADDFWKKLQPSDPAWAKLREVQTATLNLPNTGMAVAIDIGNHSDIHPNDKQTLAKRVAAEAERLAYGRKGVTAGPMYESMKIEGDAIRLGFTNVGKGLVAKGGKKLNCFAIAGKDGKFVWANARIEGASVLVWADSVKNPVAVRYAWANYPGEPNFYNEEGFPACPFRTDMPGYLLKK